MKYGRPDTNFLKWRWKPDGCELPIFDPHQFLEVVRGKSIAFVGDSLARNHMLSLMCLLSRVLYPLDVSTANDENRRWAYREYTFNVSMFWAPYLVRSERTDPNNITRPFNLYLDEFDDGWTTKVQAYDYIIISAGQWFFRPTNFYENRTLVGCLACKQDNVTQFTMNFSYERAFRTAFRAIISLANFKGVTILRTIAPSHFEGGVWDQGGDCVRTRPFNRNETVLADYNSELHKIQLKELRIAQEEGSKWGLRFRLFDVTQAMSLRPDGHPSKYGHWPTEKVTNDCVHWCLPGPIDAWNDFLQELIKREETKKSSYRYT
ncbi:protein trichome birefringence-like 19 [Coffea eugenioides]|uniref:protein trichome birefringence-like 19 n=1 Tax=Coffea eugenioides TaxID=49369 RepID=UPI000F605F7C|nr:protein trichome birefringence-like 19 [Coffea eugenioides]